MTSKTPEEYLQEPYARVLVPESSGGYYAEILEFPGCFASGETVEEAFKNVEEIAKVWIASELEQGREIPPPSDSEAFSGKFALRLPRSLHQQAARMAEREATSLNQYIATAIAARVGADDLFHRLTEKLSKSAARIAVVTPYVTESFNAGHVRLPVNLTGRAVVGRGSLTLMSIGGIPATPHERATTQGTGGITWPK